LDNRPCPYVDNRAGCGGAGVYSYFSCWFYNGFDAVYISIAYDLENRGSVGTFFELDHCNVLCFGVRYNGLHGENVNIAFVAVDDADVVDLTVAVEIQVIHL
jgi:hypothetical protein